MSTLVGSGPWSSLIDIVLNAVNGFFWLLVFGICIGLVPYVFKFTIAVFEFTIIVFKLARMGVEKHPDIVKRTTESLAWPVAWTIFLIAVSLANNTVDLPGRINAIGDKILHLLLIIVLAWGMLRFVGICCDVICDYIGVKMAKNSTLSRKDKLVFRFCEKFVPRGLKTTVWTIAILSILQSVFSLNIASLIIGAAVGGLPALFLVVGGAYGILEGIGKLFDIDPDQDKPTT